MAGSQPGAGCLGSSGVIPPCPCQCHVGWVGGSAQHPLPPQAALRRFHSLSVSSDTTLDSFASLHPDEVRGGRDGVGVWAAPPGSRGLSWWLSPQPDALPAKGREQQLSNRSIVSLADSHTEFFDACEVFLSASSSENEVGGASAPGGGAMARGRGSEDPPAIPLHCFCGFISAFSLPPSPPH